MPSHGREAKALASWRVEAGAADMREACVEPDSDRLDLKTSVSSFGGRSLQ